MKSFLKGMFGRIFGGIILLAVALSAPQSVVAQGTTTFLSNLGQASSGAVSVGSDSWLAAGFQTGNNAAGYVLNTIQLAMNDASGTPSGFTVKIYANISPAIGISPGDSLGVLSGPSDPAIAGTYTYAPGSSISLLPSTPYFVVLTSATGTATGAYEWSDAAANNYNPNGGWFSLGGGWTSGNGTSWNFTSTSYPQFAINATPAPEPGVLALFALGGLLLACQRRKKRSVR